MHVLNPVAGDNWRDREEGRHSKVSMLSQIMKRQGVSDLRSSNNHTQEN